jgi:hypothetical protein
MDGFKACLQPSFRLPSDPVPIEATNSKCLEFEIHNQPTHIEHQRAIHSLGKQTITRIIPPANDLQTRHSLSE